MKFNLLPKEFLLEFAALIIIVMTIPFWLPIAGAILAIGVVGIVIVAVLGILIAFL